MALPETFFKKLRKRLPRGYQQQVADKMGGRISRSMVGLVANRKRNNDEVLRALIALAEETARKEAAMEAAIKKL